MGYVAVSVLILIGLLNSWFLVGSISDSPLWHSKHDQSLFPVSLTRAQEALRPIGTPSQLIAFTVKH